MNSVFICVAAPMRHAVPVRQNANLAFLTLEASVTLASRVIAQRHLLRIEAGDRRFELRPPETTGSVCVDVAPGLMHATLVGGDRSTLELEWMISGEPTAIDAWALATGSGSTVEILDGLGRPMIPDLSARDPSMPPMIATPGLYLLRADTRGGPIVVRLGQSIASGALRAAV